MMLLGIIFVKPFVAIKKRLYSALLRKITSAHAIYTDWCVRVVPGRINLTTLMD